MASFLPMPSALCLTLAYASLALPLALGASCPGHKSPVLPDKVEGSEVVVQGQIQRQVKVNPGATSYTAEVDVQCVFKGGPVSANIDVIGAGREEGRCVQTDLLEGRVYLIYLNRSKDSAGAYTPTFTQDPAERKYLDELLYSCGINVQFPQGITESEVCHPDQFETDYKLEDCGDNSQDGSAATSLTAATAVYLACWLLHLMS